jgi:hypothetical protein
VLLLRCNHSPKRRKFGPQVGISISIEIDVSVVVIYYCSGVAVAVVVVVSYPGRKEKIWTSSLHINYY